MLIPNDKERPADAPAKAPDPFDPASLRLSQDFNAMVGGEKVVLSIPVRKPGREVWFRVHPGEDYRLNTLVLQLKDEEAETYLLSSSLQSLQSVETTVRPVTLFTGINRAGAVFLWPVSLPGPDGRDNEWFRTAREAAQVAMTRWIRLEADRNANGYAYRITSAELPEPSWPAKTFGELLKVAFRDRFIDSLDHPVLKRLRGEA
jgi:hypothetical protein